MSSIRSLSPWLKGWLRGVVPTAWSFMKTFAPVGLDSIWSRVPFFPERMNQPPATATTKARAAIQGQLDFRRGTVGTTMVSSKDLETISGSGASPVKCRMPITSRRSSLPSSTTAFSTSRMKAVQVGWRSSGFLASTFSNTRRQPSGRIPMTGGWMSTGGSLTMR